MANENEWRREDGMRLVLHDDFVTLTGPDLMRLSLDAGKGVVEHCDEQINEEDVRKKKIERVENWYNPSS